MKKIVMFSILIFLTVFSFSQEVEKKEIIGETFVNNGTLKSNLLEIDTTLTFANVYSDVKQALDGLATGLKVGGEHVYEILVHQELIKAYMWAGTGISFIIFISFFSYFLNRGDKNFKINNSVYGDGSHWRLADSIPTIVLSILVVGFFIGFLCQLNQGLTGFLNPEYNAIQEILKLIK